MMQDGAIEAIHKPRELEGSRLPVLSSNHGDRHI
jgi:hypothetical protein